MLRYAALLALVVCSSAPAQFPLRVGPGQRHLVDSAGKPFFLQGDSPWSLITAITEEEAERYLADRQARGFNALIVNLVEHKFNGPATRDGLLPFANNDFTRPLEAYFAHADRVLRRTAVHGMVVLLNPLYLGYKDLDEGWYQEAILNGTWNCRVYGRWLGRRYRDYTNIIWVMGGDRRAGMAREAIGALAAGIRDEAGHHLFTAHSHPDTVTMEEYGYAGLDINTTYDYGVVHKSLRRDRSHRPVMPLILFESTYEGEHNSPPVQIRRQAYWAAFGGAAGQFMGNRPIWLFDTGWQQALGSTGSQDMARLKTLLDSLRWWEFDPDAGQRIVKGGFGETNGMDWLAASVTRDGTQFVAYAATPRTLELALPAAMRGYWFEPGTGKKAEVEVPAGQARLDPPFPGDFVLVLNR